MSQYRAKPSDGVAWITGASSGLGYHVAKNLAASGWTVAATARSADDLQELADACNSLSGRIIPMPGDVTDQSAMSDIAENLVASHGGIALIILNAGVYLPLRASELKLADFDKTIAVNLNGVTNCLVPCLNHMREAGRGQIAIVSSVAGFGGLPTSAAYGATKAGLTNMAESLKFDLDLLNIHIQIVHPGFIDTPATQSNPFPMPFLMEVEDAANRLVDGLLSSGFEITFPKRFTWGLKLINLLPYPVYFWITKRATGWGKK
ncbi:MAG: SDR family NAD(P)-dependent oxidoreductase [Hyphomicrobiales bacterium]